MLKSTNNHRIEGLGSQRLTYMIHHKKKYLKSPSRVSQNSKREKMPRNFKLKNLSDLAKVNSVRFRERELWFAKAGLEKRGPLLSRADLH